MTKWNFFISCRRGKERKGRGRGGERKAGEPKKPGA